MKHDGPISKEEVTSARRAEHRYTDLQPVRKDFYPATAELIKATRASRDSSRGVDDFVLAMYIENLNRIQASATDILSVRLSKIARLAVINAFRMDVPIESLTDEERVFFERVKALAKDMKDEFERECGAKTYSSQKLETFVPQTQEPPRPAETAEPPAETVPEAPAELFEVDPDLQDGVIGDEPMDIPPDEMDAIPPDPEPAEEEEPDMGEKMILVRILEDIPTFCGYDDHNYNLHQEDVALIPEIFAKMLISGNQAVEIKPS